jgi:hypothetical protein
MQDLEENTSTAAVPTRIVVDATTLLGPPMSAIIHDLGPDEVVCPICHGVGMYKTVYKTPDRLYYGEQWNDCVPWHNQYLIKCHHCNVGKAELCVYCQKGSLHAASCQCDGARAYRNDQDDAREEKRRLTCTRLSIVNYDVDHIYAANHDEYILTEDVENYLLESSDPEDEVFFGCTAATVKCLPRAIHIMEKMQDEAYHDDVECLRFSKEAEESLTQTLADWAEKHCTFETLFYQDKNLIIDVPDAWRKSDNDIEE